MKQTILVPTDFSENAALAFRYAWHLGREFGYRICLVHVYELPVLERFLVEEEILSLTDEKVRNTFEKFVRDAQVDASANGPELNFILKEGNIVKEIAALAKEERPVFIIAGAQGSGSDHWDGIWPGGTVQKLIRKVKAPLMVVPPDAPFSPLKNIAFGTDFNSEDFDIITNLIGLARELKATLTAIHVREYPEQLDEHSLNYMKKVFADQVKDGILKLEMVDNPSVADGLLDYISGHSVELLVLLKERTNIIERMFDRSQSMQIAFRAKIPTLIFRELD